MRDIYHNIAVSQPLNPVNSTATKTSAAIDLQGYNGASVIFALGIAADTLSGSIYWTLKLQHSDDDSSYSDVGVADLLNTAATIVVDSSSKDETAYSFGYVGNKRYVKGVATPTGSHSSGTPIGIIALRGAPGYAPVN